MERLADGTWRFAVYAWTADGSDARLAPTRGMPPRGGEPTWSAVRHPVRL